MLVTEFGIIVFTQPDINSFVDVLIMALQSFRESYAGLPFSTIMDDSPEGNGLVPILVTEFGITIEVKPLQLEKAIEPMLVTEFGISIEVKPLHPLNAEEPMLVT